MSDRLEEIARRKQTLIEKAGRERDELAAACAEIRSPLSVTATLLGVGRTLRTHPIIAAALSSFLVSGYASKLLKSTGELLQLWKLGRPFWDWWRRRRKA